MTLLKTKEHEMKERILFEIPIYSMNQNTFENKWKKFKQTKIEEDLKKNGELGNYEYWLNKANFPVSVWKYNQIIGYIQIVIKNKDIIFELFITKDKNIHYNGKTKHFIEYSPTNGLHFFTDDKNDQDIKMEISKFLTMIKNEFINKNYFLDLTTYNNLINNINIKKIIEESQKLSA